MGRFALALWSYMVKEASKERPQNLKNLVKLINFFSIKNNLVIYIHIKYDVNRRILRIHY